LVSDPKCPIRLSNPKLLKYEDGGFQKVYTISNHSDKFVKRFQIKELNWFGTQEYTRDSASKNKYAFQPYEKFSNLTNEREVELVNVDGSTVGKLGLTNKPKNVWIIVITKVELSDGSIYDITPQYKEIEKATERLEVNSKMSPSEVEDKENELNRLIKEIMAKEKIIFMKRSTHVSVGI
jgi:hypothetical protein